MTEEQAIEACAKAILRNMGYREIGWEKSDAKDFATKFVSCLEALDLLPKTTSLNDHPSEVTEGVGNQLERREHEKPDRRADDGG
jgi:hypothetical protein